MFDIGIWELALIGLLALIILGPKRLPEVARTAGRWAGRVRQFVASVKEDFDQELRTEELAELRKLHHELNETRQLIQRSSSEAFEGLQGLDSDSQATDSDKPAKRKPAGRARATKRKKTVTAPRKKPTVRKKNGGAKRTRSR